MQEILPPKDKEEKGRRGEDRKKQDIASTLSGSWKDPK